MQKAGLVLTVVFLTALFFNCDKKNTTENQDIIVPETVSDIDGNIYHTKTIGNQVWLVENLKVTHYRNGDAIPNFTNYRDWTLATTDAYCNYDNNEDNVDTYGRLYNWYAIIDNRNIAPEGWHVPSLSELDILKNYLDDDISDFSVVYGGYRDDDEGCHFEYLGEMGNFWSTTEFNDAHAWYMLIKTRINCYADFKQHGFSVRCVMD